MKNSLLALALFAFVGTATANDTTPIKKGKKETCTKGMAGGCCMKGGATATVAVKAPAATTTKSL